MTAHRVGDADGSGARPFVPHPRILERRLGATVCQQLQLHRGILIAVAAATTRLLLLLLVMVGDVAKLRAVLLVDPVVSDTVVVVDVALFVVDEQRQVSARLGEWVALPTHFAAAGH